MNSYKEYYDAVDEIYSCLKRDLIGPVEEFEVLENVEPLSTYVCGILWPLRSDSPTSEADEPEEAMITMRQDDVEEMEDAVISSGDSISNANMYKPTSMGISLMLPQEANRLSVSFSGAKYTHEEEQSRVKGWRAYVQLCIW